MDRLQKVLAEAGFGSRRKCEELIIKGKVEVDGKCITVPGFTVDAEKCRISCNGVPVQIEKKVYFLVNKPKGYICTNSDELRRPRVVDLFHNISQRLYTVGRLDADTEGLIIVTNDGDVANKLSHPRYGITKTYMVEVSNKISDESLRTVKKGIWLSDGKLESVRIKNVRRSNKRSSFEMVLSEGKNREIRRMLARVGHKVRLLRRTSIGPFRLDPRIKTGKYRAIQKEKIYGLLRMS